ncbi:hypothetical protein LCGC14_1163300 [marine sediment metagenome]|uniref:Uncharacterized protein n=1 Tax=marine sediment metagenome TaxID=412755 RepID=A0A0F9MF30_9ZZZZ
MNNYSDKNILVVRNAGNPSFLSLNGEMMKIGEEFITYKKIIKFIKEGTRIEKQNIEILRVGIKKVIVYNAESRAWWCS